MQDDFIRGEQVASWYVSRRVDVPSQDLRTVTLPEVVVAPNGVSLKIQRRIFVDDDQYRSFEGVLAYPGVLSGKVRVELDLNPYCSQLGEIGLRPANRLPGLLVSAERYFDGAWSVLDALASELVGGRLESGAEQAA
jgi:hypothetical protein